jgi:hypothetical protein
MDNDRDHPRHFLNLSFSDRQGQRHEATRTVDKASWEARNVGDSLDVRYLESNPAKVRLVSEMGDPVELMYWLGGIGGIMALTGIGFIIYARRLRPGPARPHREMMQHEVNH